MSIIATNLVKSYSRRKVVNHVSLQICPGEIVGLLGPNGAGKTTTFSLIVGLERADAGTINLNGEDITKMPMYKRSQLGIAYLPQEPSIFRKLTVAENVLAVLRLKGLSRAQQHDKMQALLEEFGLDHVSGQKGYALSGGERRRTEIVRALATDPSFLLLDEPFAGIDPLAVKEIQDIVASLRQKNLGILVTDHNVRETLRITDRAYIMHNGDILVSGSAGEIAEDSLARQYYLGPEFKL